MLKLAEAATKALTVDTGIGSISKLKDLALELRQGPPKNITFTTVPVIDNPAEKVKATVVVNEATGPAGLRDDQGRRLVHRGEEEGEARRRRRSPPGSRARESAASEVRVNIYNGGAAAGAAQDNSRLAAERGGRRSSPASSATPTRR